MMPPKSSRYLYPIKDYENLEFRSPVCPWNPQTKFRADFDKVKCLEIVLTPGKFLFIPAYWWYSFKFADNTSVSCFNYRTYMNNIAISPHIFMYALQNQNVERKIAKKIDIKELNKESQITNVESSNDESPIEIQNEIQTEIKETQAPAEPSIETINSLNSALGTIGTLGTPIETAGTNIESLALSAAEPF
jgi:hypothetical protein